MLRSTLLRGRLPTASQTLSRNVVFNSLKVTSTRPLGTIPQPPGGIVGGVNDPVPIPPMDAVHGSYHWSFERLIIVGMVPLVVTPFTGVSLTPVLDATLGSLLLLHSHLGFESCIVDYIPLRVYGKWHKAAMWLLYAGTATTFFGVYKMETEDVGLTEAIAKVWKA